MHRDRSNASFGRVEDKQAEASFFLRQLSESAGNPFSFRCYFSAFASAAMSVLYALESARKQIDPDFSAWYEPKRRRLTEEDPITAYVLARRHEAIHIGQSRVNAGCFRQDKDKGKLVSEHFFSLGWLQGPEPIDVDVFSACEHTLNEITKLVEEVLDAFPHLSPDYFMDAEVLKQEGLSVEDIEEGLGLPRGWTSIEGWTDQQRLDVLRTATLIDVSTLDLNCINFYTQQKQKLMQFGGDRKSVRVMVAIRP